MSSRALQQVTIIVVCMHLLHVSSGQLESMGEKRISSKYCGRYLVNALRIVCSGVYNTPFHKKSSDGMMPPEVMQADSGSDPWGLQDEDVAAVAYPFRPRSSATTLKPRSFRRVSRGIHDECCRKSCTIHEIASYCGRR